MNNQKKIHPNTENSNKTKTLLNQKEFFKEKEEIIKNQPKNFTEKTKDMTMNDKKPKTGKIKLNLKKLLI